MSEEAAAKQGVNYLVSEAEGVLPHTLSPEELHHSGHLDAVAARDRVRRAKHLAQPLTHLPLRPHAPEERPVVEVAIVRHEQLEALHR